MSYLLKSIFVALLASLACIIAFYLILQFLSASKVQAEVKIPSSVNSYVFATPQSSRADGESKIRIFIFCQNTQGLGLSGLTTRLEYGSGLEVMPIQAISDDQGKAIFDISSNYAGQYAVNSFCSDTRLTQTLQVFFR